MTAEDPIGRANRYLGFYNEPGGLKEILDGVRHAYLVRAGDLMPNDTAALLKLGMAGKIVDQLDDHVRHIIATGQLEAANQAHAERISSLPEAARRRL